MYCVTRAIGGRYFEAHNRETARPWVAMPLVAREIGWYALPRDTCHGMTRYHAVRVTVLRATMQ